MSKVLTRIESLSLRNSCLIESAANTTHAKLNQPQSQIGNLHGDFQPRSSNLSTLALSGPPVSTLLSEVSQQIASQSAEQSQSLAALTSMMQCNFVELHKALAQKQALSSHDYAPLGLPSYLNQGVYVPLLDFQAQASPQGLCRQHQRKRRRLVHLGLVELVREELGGGSHTQSCPLCNSASTEISYLIKIRPWKMLLKRTMEAAFIWQNAHGYSSICTRLNIRSFTNPESPALRLLNICGFRAFLGEDLEPEPIMCELKKFYGDRQASPFDVNDNGFNALRVSCI